MASTRVHARPKDQGFEFNVMQAAEPVGETFSARVVLGSPNLESVNSTTDRGFVQSR